MKGTRERDETARKANALLDRGCSEAWRSAARAFRTVTNGQEQEQTLSSLELEDLDEKKGERSKHF